MDVYETHVPVLEALDPPPTRVLEFGAGKYSTKAFLAMDSVSRLVSVETDPSWRKEVRNRYRDKRWELLDGSEVPDLEKFDLVFIDDGANAQERIPTIVYVLSRKHPRVVIHDAEYGPYRDTIAMFTDDYVVHADYQPYTAVIEATKHERKKGK